MQQHPQDGRSLSRGARTLAASALPDSQGWRLFLAVVRAALALSYLGVQWFWKPPAQWAGTTVVSLFALYSLWILAWEPAKKAGAGLLGLIFDIIFFLAITQARIDPSFLLDAWFYTYLLVSAVTLHRFRDVCIAVGICEGRLALAGSSEKEALWRLVLFGGLLACALAWKKARIESRLQRCVQVAEEFRIEAEEARDQERQKLAGDFHDGPLQGFVSFRMRLETLGKILARDPQAAIEEARQLQELSESQVREMRAFLRGMRPVQVEGSSLAASLRRVVGEFQKETGIPLTIHVEEGAHIGAAEACTEVLQIVREALHNVQKHSDAARAAITVSQSPGCLDIVIEDNGSGFPFSGSYSLNELDLLGLGPASIKRRVHNLGGSMTVESRPEHGAAIRVRVPA